MKKSIILSTLLAVASLTPLAQADLNSGYAPQGPAAQGNCDLLATNTVRATFKGFQDAVVPDANGAPVNATVAVFEVIENLAHRRHSRYGDGTMQPGLVFTVEMSREIPGQPADIVDAIAELQPGDETVMRMDHLFIYGEPNGTFVRPCARIARRAIPQPSDVEPGAPATVHPTPNGQVSINGSGVVINHSFERRVVYDRRGAAITQEIEVIQESIPGTNQVRTRVFINGVEVDPQTQQPLTPAQPAQPVQPVQPLQPAQPLRPADPQPPTAPAPAPTPDDPDDDTILESDSF